MSYPKIKFYSMPIPPGACVEVITFEKDIAVADGETLVYDWQTMTVSVQKPSSKGLPALANYDKVKK